MKKFVVLSLIALLVLAFGSMAFAQAKKEEPKLEFKASGFIDAQTEYFRNATLATIALNNQKHAFMETRAHLKFDFIYGKNVSGTFHFEMDSSQWGDAAGGRNQLGLMNADQVAVEIKHLFFDFGLPFIPVPTQMRVGLQGLAVRPHMLISTDATGISTFVKVDPAMIRLFWFKYLEGDAFDSDDVDVYGLDVNAKIDKITVGGYGVHFNMNTYPVAYAAAPANQANATYVGLYADGKVGPVNINFDFIHNRGKIEPRVGADTKLRGWATRLKVDFPWEKFNFGVVGAYGSGDKRTTATKNEAYLIPPGSESPAVFGESLVFFSSWVNRGNTGIRGGVAGTAFADRPLGGVWFGKLYGSFAATPWYKVTLQALYIGDTTKNGNTVGTSPRDHKTIGWELDLINEFQIYKQLKYQIGGGFMTRGDALKFGAAEVKPKTPWIITSRLLYSF